MSYTDRLENSEAGAQGALDRRHFLRLAAAGVFTSVSAPGMSFSATSPATQMIFTASEATTLAAVADAMVPGAAKGGVVNFVSAMLASPLPTLFYNILWLPIPPIVFYKTALDEIDAYSQRRNGAPFSALPEAKCADILRILLSGQVEGWKGPPSFLAYFVIRNDALDIVYGGVDAYDRLEIPYMAHIEPPQKW